ncbi:XrtA/PEP-CTERM system histidine kinase PrsK [Emcibacter sp.]|uniref:XrtA/PEP-CTERM system histidine kinase PrsK n=1 Tax=Emcibacter sp. TaxID=1979954 RepID=UPI002AA8106F|nr:XrtA/PEP-CTERM system histidine kinase PrsK [Emcibacter sp.]
MEGVLGDIGFYTYALATGAFLLLAAVLLTTSRSKLSSTQKWLVLVLLINVVWAFVHTLAYLPGNNAGLFLTLVEFLRNSSWIFLLVHLMFNIWCAQGNEQLARKIGRFYGIGFGLLLTLELLIVGGNAGWSAFVIPPKVSLYENLFISILVLLLVENVYRSTAEENRWGIRYLCLALGTLYIFDFLLYADNILFTSIGPKLYDARGLINFLVVPLIGISASRNPDWSLKVQISRKAAFHTITLIGSGAYLIGMSAAGYYLQNHGGKWGNLLQATFIVVASLALVAALSSGRFRSQVKVLLSKHLFRYKYDYRDEWLRFIGTISDTKHHYGLRERTIQAVADIMDSPGGGLWLREKPDAYVMAAKWNYHPKMEGELDTHDEFIRFIEQQEWVVNLDEVEDGNIKGANCPIPNWLLESPELWLVVPLLHHDRTVGFIILMRPRGSKDLNWESLDLLKIVGRQVGSYLAEQIAEQALAEAREFEAFNRKFAFVVHDIKNLASQLSLIVRNAEKHANNPEFQQDMLLTVRDSAEKMNNLLSRINVVQEPSREKDGGTSDLVVFLETVTVGYAKRGTEIDFRKDADCLMVNADLESLDTVFMHLVQNAIDACDPGDLNIRIKLSSEDDYAIVKLSDNGCGMSEQFIRDELFRPFRSTKEKGYGIGAYESREIIKRMGGRLSVKSATDEGTTMTVYLKLASQNEDLLDEAVS